MSNFFLENGENGCIMIWLYKRSSSIIATTNCLVTVCINYYKSAVNGFIPRIIKADWN